MTGISPFPVNRGVFATGDRVLSEATVQVVPKERPLRQLLLDVAQTCRTELKTGIERVTRALVLALLGHPPLGFRVKPVYLAEAGGLWHYRAARRFTRDLLGEPSDESNDPLVKPQAGDVLLVLDNSGDRVIAAEAAGLYTYYRNRGVAVTSPSMTCSPCACLNISHPELTTISKNG